MAKRICVIEGCENYRAGRGWCAKHWRRWSIHGDPLGGKPGQAFTKALDYPDGTRTCSQCDERKPIEQFDKVQSATLGRRSNCKACRSEQMKARYRAKREDLLAASKARRDAERAAKAAAKPDYYRDLDLRQAARLAPGWVPVDTGPARRHARLVATKNDRTVTRTNLRNQYGDDCFYCGIAMTFIRIPRGQRFPSHLATIEHVVPLAAGGTHTWDNVVLACRTCNCNKRQTPLAEWLERRVGPK